MSDPISFGELDFNIVASMAGGRADLETETPFQMLVIGDFSGRANRGLDRSGTLQAGLKPIPVDRDTIDEVLDRLEVKIELPLLGKNAPPVEFKFGELNDFHPDVIFQKTELFQVLKKTRQGFSDPAILATFVAELQAPPSPLEKTALPEVCSRTATGSLLEQIIEQSQPEIQASALVSPKTEWGVFLHDIVKPHLVAKDNPQLEEMIDSVDTAASEMMRMILHHQDFQDVEAAWRGLAFTASRLETDSRLKLFLLDVSKEEFAADLTMVEDLRRTGLYKLLVEQAVGTAGGQPWAVVAGNYTFDNTIEDMELLGRMAKIAQAAGLSFVTAAGEKFFCENAFAETPDPDAWQSCATQEAENTWQILRHIPEAAHLGLALPRFLLRLPYGADTDPLDAFTFEEMVLPPVHADYLWGNPSFALMLLIGQNFSLQGWQMRLTGTLEINSLPLHVYKDEGESHLKPCAEVMLSQRAAEHIIEEGMMPLLSFFNQDRIRLGRFQSIADPPAQLAGPWE